MTVFDKIRNGSYQNPLPYPKKSEPDYDNLRAAYHNKQRELEEQFKKDLFDEFGVTYNPKAELCYSKAWDLGHSSGYSEVASYFSDLVDLIR